MVAFAEAIRVTVCAICGNSNSNRSFIAREMKFGFRDEFEYFECSRCGCLQINEIPGNLSKYYPANYYSFQTPRKDNFIKSYLKLQRAQYYLFRSSIIGMLVSKVYGIPDHLKWLRRAKVSPEYSILDVGCGTGGLLLEMRKCGFSNPVGVDPYIKEDMLYENGVEVLKKTITEIGKEFDFVILNHSFEHMPSPVSVFEELYHLLKPKRYVLIRTPVASSFAWRKYGVDWLALDAPRHLFVHTVKSIQVLADRVGFRIEDIVFDSHALQFWGSEQYQKNISFWDDTSYDRNPRESIFTEEQIQAFTERAKELNASNDGDTASFYLYKNAEIS